MSSHVMNPLESSFVKVGSGELSTRGWVMYCTAKHKNPHAETSKIPVLESHVTSITPLVGARFPPLKQDPEKDGELIRGWQQVSP
jgi:hypothetical protein